MHKIDSDKEYFYDTANNTIFKIIGVDTNCNLYYFKWITGESKGICYHSWGYNELFTSPQIIFGSLETLKVLYYNESIT